MADVVASKERSISPVGTPAAGTPVVIDLGKHKKKRINELRRGREGKLLAQVSEAVEALRSQNAISADAQTIIVVVREKSRGRILGF